MAVSFKLRKQPNTIDELISRLDDILDNDCIDPNSITWNGMHLFLYVCQHNRIDILRKLIEDERFDFNIACDGSYNIMHMACMYGHLEIIRILFENINIKTILTTFDVNGNTAFHAACSSGQTDIVKFLIDTGEINVNQVTRDKQPPLFIAAQTCRYEMVKFLLTVDEIDVNAVDKNGNTILNYAINRRCYGIIDLLLACERIDVNRQDHKGMTPLCVASVDYLFDTVNKLLAHYRIIPNTSKHFVISEYGKQFLDLL